jgi:putative Mn2+ efflux pump MntP
MTNLKRLILANVFALVAVVALLGVFKFLGIEIGKLSGSFLPNFILLTVPQVGFAYFYWMTVKNRKQIA